MNRLFRLVFPHTSALGRATVLKLVSAVGLGGALCLASGCYVRPEPVVVGTTVSTSPDYGTAYAYPTVPPPAPIVEYRPPPPAYGYTWVDG